MVRRSEMFNLLYVLIVYLWQIKNVEMLISVNSGFVAQIFKIIFN